MEVASQGRVGPEGGGEATVFNTSGFYDQMYNIQKDIMAERKKKQEDLKQQQQTWNALLEDPGDVWQSDFEYVNKAVNEYNDFIIDLRAKGIDPGNMDPSLMRKMKELEANIRRTTAVAKDNETYSNQSFNVLNQDKANKYNKDHATKWLQDYADPNKTPQDRAKMRTESNPFKINYNMIDFIEKTIPEPEKFQEGNMEVTQRNKEAHRGLVLDFIMNDPSGQDIFESLKKDGEDEAAFAERVAVEGQKKYPAQKLPKSKSTGGGNKSDKTFRYGGNTWGDLSIEANEEADPQYFSSGVNKMKVIRSSTNADLPAIAGYTDDNGVTMPAFKPATFFWGKDNKVSVFGYEYDNKGDVVDPNGKFIDYNKNRSLFKSQMEGFDVEEQFKKLRGGKTSEKAKQIKRSEIESKRGGYTVAEYEKLLRDAGVTILEGQ
jgi:hypothetical protein